MKKNKTPKNWVSRIHSGMFFGPVIISLALALAVSCTNYIDHKPVRASGTGTGIKDESGESGETPNVKTSFINENFEPVDSDQGLTLLTLEEEDGNILPTVGVYGEKFAHYSNREHALEAGVNYSFEDEVSIMPNQVYAFVDDKKAVLDIGHYNSVNQTLTLFDNETEEAFPVFFDALVFKAYVYDSSLTESENIRLQRAAITSALTEAIAQSYSNVEEGRFIGGIISSAMKIFNGAMRIIGGVTQIFVGITTGNFTPVIIGVNNIFVGIKEIEDGLNDLRKIILNPRNDDEKDIPGSPEESLTGKPGPVGTTILVDLGDSGLPYHLELAPADGTYVPWIVANNQNWYAGTQGWRLPSVDELARLHQLCYKYSLFSADKIAQGDRYVWTSQGTLPSGPGDFTTMEIKFNYDVALCLLTGEFINFNAGAAALQYALVREYYP